MERNRYSSRDDERDGGRRRGARDDDRDDRGDDRGGRGGGQRYSYEPRDSRETKSRSEGGPGDYDVYLEDGVKLFKADKTNTIRILPPTWKGAKHYGYDLHMHFGVGPDRQSYMCPNKMEDDAMAYADRIEDSDRNLAAALRAHRGKCPICEEREVAVAAGDDDLAKQLGARKRVLVYLIDRNKEKDGLLAWAMPWTVDRDICAISIDRKTGEALPIDHPQEGFDVFFDKKGEKDRTEYLGMQLDRRDSDLGDDKWLDQAMREPLPTKLVFYDYDTIAKAFGGGASARRGGRDRDDRSSDDRGRDRGGRGRDESRTDNKPRDRGRDRDRDEPVHTWDSVHKLEGTALDRLVDEERLRVDPSKYKSDEELADAICEEMRLDKPRADERESRDRGSSRSEPVRGGDDPRERLRAMREERDREESRDRGGRDRDDERDGGRRRVRD